MSLPARPLSDHPIAVAKREVRELVRAPPFDDRVALLVIEALAQGMRLGTLHSMAGYPPYWVINQWRHAEPDFDEACVRASEAAADMLMAETIEIADDRDRPPACRAISIQARHAMVKVLNRKKYDPATRVELTQRAGRADDLSDDELAAVVRARGRAAAIDVPQTGDDDANGA